MNKKSSQWQAPVLRNLFAKILSVGTLVCAYWSDLPGGRERVEASAWGLPAVKLRSCELETDDEAFLGLNGAPLVKMPVPEVASLLTCGDSADNRAVLLLQKHKQPVEE